MEAAMASIRTRKTHIRTHTLQHTPLSPRFNNNEKEIHTCARVYTHKKQKITRHLPTVKVGLRPSYFIALQQN